MRGSMSNMVTNTDKQLNIQSKVDPGNQGLQICLCMCSMKCSDVSKTEKIAARLSHTIKYCNLYNVSGLR